MSAPTPDQLQARFEELQAHLVPLWASMQEMTDDEQTIVVVPSLSLDLVEGSSLIVQPYEERYLFLVFLLRQPRAKMIYLTSEPILPSVVDYYLDLIPDVPHHHARKRLHTLPVLDPSSRPLTQKILERPRLVERIRALIDDPRRAHLVPFITSDLERDLAVHLGIPMYGSDPKHSRFGTKTGGRQLFEEEGVSHPLGARDLWSADAVVDAVVDLRVKKPGIRQVIVKLNEGVSGDGNALVDLAAVPAPGEPGVREAIVTAVAAMAPESAGTTFAAFAATLAEWGGVVEERIQGSDFVSPSVQLRATPLGDLELLSTHDQLLGGPSGQAYLGCLFPADAGYASLISAEAAKVGHRLVREGVLGRFALDFVAVRNEAGEWEGYAIEINLRKGGTTHPFLTLAYLTDGVYDAEAATFTTPLGEQKFLVASDHVDSPLYRGLTPDDVFDAAVRSGLHWDKARQVGVVFHMLSALTAQGHLGMTAIGNSHEHARELYDAMVAVLDAEAAEAMASRPLPD